MCFHLFIKNRSELVDYVSHCVVIVWDTRMVVEPCSGLRLTAYSSVALSAEYAD